MIVVVWLLAFAAYGGFFSWYTNLQGPLSVAEVERYKAQMQKHRPDTEGFRLLVDFMNEDDGREFFIVNVLHRKEGDGEHLEKYMSYMLPEQLKRACLPLFFGSAVAPVIDRVGLEFDGGRNGRLKPKQDVNIWTGAALFRYRSRRDFMDIVLGMDFQDAHEHKIKGLTKTLAFPVSVGLNPADPRILLGLLVLFVCSLYTAIAMGRRGPLVVREKASGNR